MGVVAAIAIAVAAPMLAPGLVGFLGSIGVTVSAAVATAIIGATLAIGLSLAMRALGVGSVPSAKNQPGPPMVFRQSISNSFIVYGLRRVGGLLVFFHASVSGSDHFRYFVIAVAGHRCQGVVDWMLNDEIVTVDGSDMVTSGKYAGAAWLWFQRGLASETANSTFVAETGGQWTSAHKGNGVAAIYAKFKMTDAVVQAGMPNITAVIEGRDEILDPRGPTTGYTRNASLIFYDFMTVPREEGGFGAYDDEIPEDAWINAQANVCDETVSSEARYSLDAVITTGAAPAEVRDALIVNQAGTYSYSGGKHQMRPGYWVPVSVVLSEDDLAGPIQVSPFLTSDTAANEVQGTYIDPSANYLPAPLTTQSVASADIRQLDLDLAFTTSLKQADRIANIMLKRAQAEKTVVWPMNIIGLGVQAMDTVQCDSARYGLSNYAFSAGNWALSADWGVVLQLREENEEIYGEPDAGTPTTPPAIVQPTEPLLTEREITSLIVNSTLENLSFSIDATGSMTISTHNRIYPDKQVSVTGDVVPPPAGAVAGDLVHVSYHDPDRLGGAVTYEAHRVAGAVGELPKAGPSDPYLHSVAVGLVPPTGTTPGGSAAGSGGGGGGRLEWDLGDNR